MSRKKTLSTEEIKRGFLEDLQRSCEGKSPRYTVGTVIRRKQKAKYLLEFLEQTEQTFYNCNPFQFVDWCLDQKELKSSFIQNILSVNRGFYRWIERYYFHVQNSYRLPKNPWNQEFIRLKKSSHQRLQEELEKKSDLRILSLEEVHQLIATARLPYLKCAIALMAGGGLRLNEVVSFRLLCLREDEQKTRLEIKDIYDGKVGKLRSSFLMQEFVPAVIPRIYELGETPFANKERCIRAACSRLRAKTNIQFTPHQLRHFFARQYIRDAETLHVNHHSIIEQLRRFLGHSNQHMTEYYADLKQAFPDDYYKPDKESFLRLVKMR